MKVKPYRKCDICGKEYDKNIMGNLKIKTRWTYSLFTDGYAGWDKLDVCSGCAEKMITWIREHQDKENK
jgi:hypothetical protein